MTSPIPEIHYACSLYGEEAWRGAPGALAVFWTTPFPRGEGPVRLCATLKLGLGPKRVRLAPEQIDERGLVLARLPKPFGPRALYAVRLRVGGKVSRPRLMLVAP